MFGAGKYFKFLNSAEKKYYSCDCLGVYGECEFIFASIKVITITGLIVRLQISMTHLMLKCNLP